MVEKGIGPSEGILRPTTPLSILIERGVVGWLIPGLGIGAESMPARARSEVAILISDRFGSGLAQLVI